MDESKLILAGKKALITGASQGLGKNIAHHFVAAGASVFLLARQSPLLSTLAHTLNQAKPLSRQQIVWQVGDISKLEQIEQNVRQVSEQLGEIHILVNNAGIVGPIGLFELNDWDEWVATLQVNLLGTVAMCRAVVPIMKQQGYGKIINLSGGGATSPRPRFSAYAVSKVGVVRLTETLAHELAPFKIDVNAIAPGVLNTQMLQQVLEAGPELAGEEYNRSVKQEQQGGNSFEEAAELAVFLASTASDGISGRLISALWDKWRAFPNHFEQIKQSDVFTLRRIVPEDRGWEKME